MNQMMNGGGNDEKKLAPPTPISKALLGRQDKIIKKIDAITAAGNDNPKEVERLDKDFDKTVSGLTQMMDYSRESAEIREGIEKKITSFEASLKRDFGIIALMLLEKKQLSPNEVKRKTEIDYGIEIKLGSIGSQRKELAKRIDGAVELSGEKREEVKKAINEKSLLENSILRLMVIEKELPDIRVENEELEKRLNRKKEELQRISSSVSSVMKSLRETEEAYVQREIAGLEAAIKANKGNVSNLQKEIEDIYSFLEKSVTPRED